jgi:hypothetical protein
LASSRRDILKLSGVNLKTGTPVTRSTLVYLEVIELLDLFHCSTLTLGDFENFGCISIRRRHFKLSGIANFKTWTPVEELNTWDHDKKAVRYSAEFWGNKVIRMTDEFYFHFKFVER